MCFGQAFNCDAQLSQLVGGDGHARADELDGSVTVNGLDGIVSRQQVLEDSEEHDDQQGTEEDIHGALALGSNLFVEGGGVAAVDVLTLCGVGKLLLELGVLVQVLTALVGGDGSDDDTQQTGGDGYHEHLRDCDVVAVGAADEPRGPYRQAPSGRRCTAGQGR